NKTFGDPDFGVSATATSGLAVAFAAAGNCTISGASVHITGAGPCTVTASQPGDGNDQPAPDVPQSFTIGKASQTIALGVLASKTFGDPDFGVSATATSGLAVAFAAAGNCTISGATVHITAAGACTVTASQSGDGNDAPAPDLPRSFTIGQASQTVTFTDLANKTIGDPDFTVGATASSGLSVAFSARGDCTVSGSTVHVTKVGSCTITASQPGNGNYIPAPSVTRSFAVAYASCLVAADKDGDDDDGDHHDGDDRQGRDGRDGYDRDRRDGRFDGAKLPNVGSTLRIKLTLCSSTGANLSSPAVIVTAVELTQLPGGLVAPIDAGRSNPGNRFQFDRDLVRGGGYVFNLGTRHLSAGTWGLTYIASGDSTAHTLTFSLR
ncbi:MAG: hypothetical protein DMF78_18540, partial [Acidobacteria bacterium]